MMKKPMLAGKCSDTSKLAYPVLCTPKLDGVRALIVDGLVSRNWKPIPNTYTRNLFSDLPKGCDGELIGFKDGCEAGKGFNETQGDVMRESGEPDVRYYIFDYCTTDLTKPYKDRMVSLKDDLKIGKHKNVILVLPVLIKTEEELLKYEQECLAKGYEGVMIRSPYGPYKEGRSTEREGYLLKLKRFEDSEAKVIGFEERMHNANEAKKDAFGRTERSSAKAGLVPDGTLGKLFVRDVKTSVEFEIGTGFDDAQRAEIWKNKKTWLGKIVKYKYQACGMKDKPRFPVYIGIRDERDVS
jgi:DNA ligase-1